MGVNCVFFCQHNKKGVIIVMLLYSYKYGLASLLTLHVNQSYFVVIRYVYTMYILLWCGR